MSKEDFEKIKYGSGILISTNGFLSTSRDLHVALSYIAGNNNTDNNVSVLFEITADPQLESISFADIEKYSRMKNEKEILFNLGSVFIIIQVQYDSIRNLWQVQMKATDEGSKHVNEYLKIIRKQMEEEYSPTILFGCFLWRDIGEVDKAEKYFKTLLKSLPDNHEDIPTVYHQIGNVYLQKNEFDMALDHYTKALDLRRQYLPSDHFQIAASLNNIGLVYEDKKDYDLALEYCKQALTIWDKTYPGDHLNKAKGMMNIGVVFRRKKNYDNALEYLIKSLEMLKRVLPEQHHTIARCLCNIGAVYEDQLKFDQALEFNHQTYEMNEKVLPSDHIYLTKDLNGIVNLYKKAGQYETARHFCIKKLNEQLENLPENHSRIGHTLKTIGDIYNENNDDQALDHFKKALQIYQVNYDTEHEKIKEIQRYIDQLDKTLSTTATSTQL
jgi:tetratricopeptide (TPR) repeat protein